MRGIHNPNVWFIPVIDEYDILLWAVKQTTGFKPITWLVTHLVSITQGYRSQFSHFVDNHGVVWGRKVAYECEWDKKNDQHHGCF